MRAGSVFDRRKIQINQSRVILITISIMITVSVSFTLQAQLDDPTRPPGYPLTLPGGKKSLKEISYTLSSVYISASRRTAVINNKSVELGGYVGNAKVIAILPSSVKLKRRGKIFSVRLLSQVVKKTPAR